MGFSKFENIEINHALIEIRPGMTVKCGMNCEFLGIVTEGFTIPETVFSKSIFVKICVWSSDLN